MAAGVSAWPGSANGRTTPLGCRGCSRLSRDCWDQAISSPGPRCGLIPLRWHFTYVPTLLQSWDHLPQLDRALLRLCESAGTGGIMLTRVLIVDDEAEFT